MESPADDFDQYLARFGLAAFRPGQREVISAVLSKQDCLCIMPTGGGKSLCYQLPAIARSGLTLVVSPLIALMKDQVDALQAAGIAATFINSSLSPAEQRERMDQMAAGRYDLVYIAPERLRNSLFLEKLRSTEVQLLAVDEAHCISEWGHDFRPDYARLGRFRQRLGYPQTIALTATATPTVRSDVARQLELREPRVFITGFARTNLHFEVETASSNHDKLQTLLAFLSETPGAGIIYAATRKRCEELVEELSQLIKRRAAVYHAGLMPDDRRQVQDDFMSDRVQIIVATNAFGMGIDKPDLRFVVHYNIPGSVEAYYQEAGRAGRDGLNSRCLLLYSPLDRKIQEFFIDSAYPHRDYIQRVYDFLRQIHSDPIEITLQEIKDQLQLPITSEGIGSCEKLLEKCGALERLDSRQNTAGIKLDSDLPTLVDLLPKESKNQRKVLRAIEGLVGELRHERVFVSPTAIARAADLDAAATARALRELAKLKAFDYVPPFRGRAIHMRERVKPFNELGIDFEELERRKRAEYEKLDCMIDYATTRKCRQLTILEYFGDPAKKICGLCDNCGGVRHAALIAPGETANDEAVVDAVRMVLSGAARMNGKFGKTLLVQMLCGSQSAKLSKLGLDQLSTFGLFQRFTQLDVTALVDALIKVRLLQQVEVNKFRPTIQLTEYGEEVMRGKSPLAEPLALDAAFKQRLRTLQPPQRSASEREPVAAAPEEFEPQSFEDIESVPDPRQAGESPLDPRDGFDSLREPTRDESSTLLDRHRPSHYWTWRVLNAGFTAEQCQWIRQIDGDALYDHVLRAAREGLAVDPRWLLEGNQLHALHDLIGDQSPEQIRPLLAQLPSGIRYRDVQLYLLTRNGNPIAS